MINPFYQAGRVPSARFRAAGDDSQLRALWSEEVKRRYRGKTVQKYTDVVDRLFEFLAAEGKTFASMSEQDILDYLSGIASKCRNFVLLREYYRCRENLFEHERTPPSFCSPTCSMYGTIKAESYLTHESALARFVEFALEQTDYPAPASFGLARKRMAELQKRRRIQEREDPRRPRRALATEELAALFRTTHSPRDRFILALMIKTGLRHTEALLLEDTVTARAEWRSERLMAIPKEAGVKRLGNGYVVVDDQLLGVLERYLDWKDGRREGRTYTGRLLMTKNGGDLGPDGMLDVWREAGERAGIRIHPTIDAPLTPHSARYTFTRLLEEAGFSAFWIARLRGDVNAPEAATKSAWTYAKRAPEELREAYLEKFPRLPM